jgi:hypothetical protein
VVTQQRGIVFFRDWKKVREDRSILSITSPPSLFFRKVCAATRRAFKSMPEDQLNSSWRNCLDREIVQSFGEAAPASQNRRTGPRGAHQTEISASHTYRGRTVFLCYSSSDGQFAEKLANDLRSLGLGVWFDKWEIGIGDSILERVEEGIQHNDFLAIILSPESIASPWVRLELNAAHIRELEDRRVAILPILYKECDVPLRIADRKYADFTSRYAEGLESLLAALAPETSMIDIAEDVRTLLRAKQPRRP